MLRMEPPMSVGGGSFGGQMFNSVSQYDFEFNPVIPVQEMSDTLRYYIDHDARKEAQRRDQERVMGDLPPQFQFLGMPDVYVGGQ